MRFKTKPLYLLVYSISILIFCGCTDSGRVVFNAKIYQSQCETIPAWHLNPQELIAEGSMVAVENHTGVLNPNKKHWIYIEAPASRGEYVLSFGKPISRIEVYPFPYKKTSCIGGAMVAAAEKCIPGSDILLDFEAPAYLVSLENGMYSKLRTQDIKLIPFTQYQKQQKDKTLLQGIVQGCLWLMIVFNLILYTNSRKSIYLYYILFVLCNSLYLFYSFGYSEQYIFPGNAELNHALLSFQLIGLIFYSLFLRIVFVEHCPAFSQKADGLFIVPYCIFLAAVVVVMAIATYTNMVLFVRLIAIVNIISGLVAAGCFVWFFRISDVFARHIAIGSAMMMAGGYITVSKDFFYQPSDVLPYQTGLLLELIIFSYALNLLYINETKRRNETELARLKLQNEVAAKNRELVQKVMQLTSQAETLSQLKEVFKENNSDREESVRSIYNQIKSPQNTNLWKEFEMHFNKTHPNFYSTLLKQYPELTSNEVKLCAFMKLNLNTKDIALITQRSAHSIETMRSRIRKKMDLPRNANLFLSLSGMTY